MHGFPPNDNGFNNFFALLITGFYFAHRASITCQDLCND
jgi:hypothetical protein